MANRIAKMCFGASLLLCTLIVFRYAADPGAQSQAGLQIPSRARIPEPFYYVVDSLRRVQLDDPGPARGARLPAASISAAANEYEAFQLVLYGGASGLRGVNALVTRPLVNGNGSSIPTENVAFYREHYVTVSSPSGDHGGAAGIYPDALIPFRNPFTGETLGSRSYPAAPFDVPPHQNQPIYVEVYVPPNTSPGLYSGVITVVREGAVRFVDVPVSVNVWNFALPVGSSMRTGFQSYDSEHWLGPAQYYGYQEHSKEHRALAKSLDELLIAHRLMPESPMDTGFDVASDGRIVPDAGRDAVRLSYLQRPEYTDFQLTFFDGFPFPNATTTNRSRAITYLRAAYDWFAARRLSEKVFVRPGDEPSTRQQLTRVGDLAQLALEANPRYRVAMTVDPTNPEVPGLLYGRINRIIAEYSLFDPIQLAARQAAGDELWTYTALTHPDSPNPNWQIDFPLLNFRIVPWINFRYGVSGLLYWTTTNWSELLKRGKSPWNDPCSHAVGSTCFNGDGMLIYPGREINFVAPQYAYGSASPAAVFGPVPSLRLKALRDGIEDYEYLVMAALLQRDAALQQAIRVGCNGNSSMGDAKSNCFHDWNQNPESLLEARERLAAIIQGRSR